MTNASAAISTDIEALAFFSADHATVENGKVYVNGGFWDRINQPSYPAIISLSVVAVLRIPFRAYHQDHRFEVGMEDADGQKLSLNIEGEFRVGAGPDMRLGDPTIMPVAVALNGVTIEKAGDYSFVLSIDGSEIARYQVRAAQIGTVPIQGGSTPPPDDTP